MAEAKANLSYHEAQQWFAYIRRRGGLRHIERLLATIATQINRLAGGEAEITDFLPELKQDEHDIEASMADVMNIFAGVV